MENNGIFLSGEHWYCVRTKPKKERAAASHIYSNLGIKVLCPQLRFRRKTVRGPVWFQEAMFPGYFFARFDLSEQRRAVAYAPGVLNLPRFNDRYVAIPDRVIESIRTELDEDATADASVPLRAGDETTILEGSMQGIKVKVVRLMPAKDRVRVLLEMLGTLVETDFPTDALEHHVKHRETPDD